MPAAVAGALAEHGTEVIFGVPGGGPNLDLIGACEAAGLRFVLTHGETAAAIMAATYAELNGRPGACLATRGPGATSLATGIAHAWLDRCPLLAVTDTVPGSAAARISHQRLPHDRLLGGCAKLSIRAGATATAAREALSRALAPPWGPVHLDLDPDAGDPRLAPPRREEPSADVLSVARRELRRARRPLVIAGVGARHAHSAVQELVSTSGAPILTTYKAKGCVPEDAEQAAGLLTGATIEAEVLEAADLILAVGLDPVELIPAPWPYAARVVAIGPWRTPDPYFPVAAEIVGPPEPALEALADDLDATGWERAGTEYRARGLAALHIDGPGLTPAEVVLAARAAHPPGTIATVDSGAHMLVVMPLWDVSGPGQALISSGLATMGFALPAAIAAALVRPDQRVVCFTGDGGLAMCAAELETAARLRLPITVVVFDDATLSLIKIKQRPRQHGGDGAVRYSAVDFASVGRAHGVPATSVADVAGLTAALREATARDGPYLVDVAVDPSSYPQILSAIRGPKTAVLDSGGSIA
jgi:acetolactate synthase-1/2/3 large subunit